MAETVDEKLLESLMTIQKHEKLEFSIEIDEKSYVFDEASILKSPTPVHRPTHRGGVYFSDTYAYKIKGIVHDPSIIPLLSKTMLGPNTEFRDIVVKAQYMENSKNANILLYTNLTNSMQSKSKVELNLVITRVEKY